ncbi:hypothetical protein QYE76_040600 [Lolium multiflorum]|uniref:CCHC-type domain-containing protein n=1 Tax=Lolium multiflorum TaxID=4521 RepID=A0AAD8TD82_LOLMU|nr:hypothetical protein QYE76_040600 [Lolium multiflorum]
MRPRLVEFTLGAWAALFWHGAVGNMVLGYPEENVREFAGLSRRAAEEVNTEYKRKKRFMRGLNPQFKVLLRATEFQELVDAAITLEDDFKQLEEEKRKKARFEPKKFISNKPNTSLSFKPRYNNYNNNQKKFPRDQYVAQIVCCIYGMKGHISKDCRRPKVICFGCRQEGHILKDCLNRKNGGVLSPEFDRIGVGP